MSTIGPTTPIQIMSNAAMILGKSPFTSIDQANKLALSLQKAYDSIIPGELGSLNWGFAKKVIQLSLNAGVNPNFAEWTNIYDLPPDFLIISRVWPPVDYQVYENKLYTNTDQALWMEYGYNAPVTSWVPPFKKYAQYLLAEEVGISSTENPQIYQTIQIGLKTWRAKAMFSDSQNSPSKTIWSQPWITARYGRHNVR